MMETNAALALREEIEAHWEPISGKTRRREFLIKNTDLHDLVQTMRVQAMIFVRAQWKVAPEIKKHPKSPQLWLGYMRIEYERA